MAETSLVASEHPNVSAYLTQLLRNGNIIEDHYKILNDLHEREMQSAMTTTSSPDSYAISHTVSGNITISSTFTINCAMLEAVSRVFNTTELLENVLSQLPPSDLIAHVPLVCRGFNSLIKTSILLRRLLFRAPDFTCPEIKYVSDALRIREEAGLEIKVRDRNREDKEVDSVVVTVTFYAQGCDDRLNSLLLSQPPLKHLTVEHVTRFNGFYNEIYTRKQSLPGIYVEAGLTVRDLLEWREKLGNTEHPAFQPLTKGLLYVDFIRGSE